MSKISFNIDNILPFMDDSELGALQSEVTAHHDAMENGTSKGGDYLGWLHLPSKTSKKNT